MTTDKELDRLVELSEKAELIVKGYWPPVGGQPECHWLACSEGGVSSRALPLTKEQVEYLYGLDAWFRANLPAIRRMEK